MRILLTNNNFFLLEESFESEESDLITLKGYAEGKYDKQSVAISVILQELKEFTHLIIKAMSDKEQKLTDLLKEINFKCDDIKLDTEQIREYTESIEYVFEKVENLEVFLKARLASDFEKIKNIWNKYKEGKISKKQLIEQSIKIIGKRFIKKVLKEYF